MRTIGATGNLIGWHVASRDDAGLAAGFTGPAAIEWLFHASRLAGYQRRNGIPMSWCAILAITMMTITISSMRAANRSVVKA